MNVSNRFPNILLFEDDDDIRKCWEFLVEDEKIPSLKAFESWEDFVKNADPEIARNAVVFVDFNFESKGSRFNGIHIATELKKLGVQRIYSISSDPSRVAQHLHLFEAVLGTKFPRNLRFLIPGATFSMTENK